LLDLSRITIKKFFKKKFSFGVYVTIYCWTIYILLFIDEEMIYDKNAKPSLSSLLTSLVPGDGTNLKRISVSRENILEDSIIHFKKHDYNCSYQVRVRFEGEPAIDAGGPRREYFTMLLKSLVSCKSSIRLFEGKEGRLLPMKNTDALRGQLFKIAGRMISTSIVNGGPGFPCLSPPVYEYLVQGFTEELVSNINKDDIFDIDASQAIDKVM
jgi:hypothetical protein